MISHRAVFLIILSCCVLYNEANEIENIQEIRFSEPPYYIRPYDTHVNVAVLLNKPLNLVFEKFQAKNASCYIGYSDILIIVFNQSNTHLNSNGSSTLKVAKITSEMSTQWRCTATNSELNYMNYLFVIRVKGASKVSVNIVGINVTFTETDLSVDHDGVYEFSCEEGSGVDLTCSNIYDDGIIRLRYYDPSGNMKIDIKRTRPKEVLRFQKFMRADDDRSFIECSFTSVQINQQEFVYRTIFTVKKKPSREIILAIDGVKLTPRLSMDSGTDVYDYKFIYSKKITVTCEKNSKLPGDIKMSFIFKPFDLNAEDTVSTPLKYSFVLDTRYLNGAQLQCYFGGYKYMVSADVKFMATFDHDPVLLGLPPKNILYEYNDNEYKWVTVYEFSINETLYLKCATIRNTTLKWYMQGTQFSAEMEIDQLYGTRYILSTLNLNTAFTSSWIVCEDTSKSKAQSVNVTLYQKQDLPPDKFNTDLPNDALAVIIGGVVGVLVILIAAVFTYCWCTTNRNKNNVERLYESYNENDNSIPPFPSQWETNEYTYISNEYNYIKNDGVMLENSLYCGNAPGKRTTANSCQIENHYAEIDDFISRRNDKKDADFIGYAVPYSSHVKNEPSTSEKKKEDCSLRESNGTIFEKNDIDTS